MESADDIYRELSGKPAAGEYRGSKKAPRRSKPAAASGRPPRRPTAPPLASEVAQSWMDAAAVAGFDPPYDTNYLALAVQRRVDSDPEIRVMLKDHPDRARRWLLKMVERWWAEYLTGEVTAHNAKEYFLSNDWIDLRNYARSCLRAAYLREHGRSVGPAVYENQVEYRDRLARIRLEDRLDALTREDDTVVELDETRRSRLSSWRKRSREEPDVHP